MNQLEIEARKVENRINIYDRQLLALEESKPLKDIVEREKKLPWWGYLIAIVVDLFYSAYLMFVTGEKMEEVFDDYGNKIGWKGGEMGLTFFTLVLTFALIFALICNIKGIVL
jgi:hypothetical protein